MTELPATRPLPGYLIERHRSCHARHFADNRAWYAPSPTRASGPARCW